MNCLGGSSAAPGFSMKHWQRCRSMDSTILEQRAFSLSFKGLHLTTTFTDSDPMAQHSLHCCSWVVRQISHESKWKSLYILQHVYRNELQQDPYKPILIINAKVCRLKANKQVMSWMKSTNEELSRGNNSPDKI